MFDLFSIITHTNDFFGVGGRGGSVCFERHKGLHFSWTGVHALGVKMIESLHFCVEASLVYHVWEFG